MKNEIKTMLQKQDAWQKQRKVASWGDKLRQAVAARDSLGSFCKSNRDAPALKKAATK
jgi:hypothetical protein